MNRPVSLAAAFLAVFAAGAALAAEVRQFVPQGRIDQQTRATAQFTADMVKLGDASAPAPFTVDCGQARGSGHWADARTWAWQLERPLQAGERCQFVLRPGLAAVNGEAVGGRSRFDFFAAGPWPRSILPRPGGQVDEEQAFVINGGGPLKAASVVANVWCEADGVGNRIPVRFVPEAQRRDILAHVHGGFGPAPLVLGCAERLPPGARMRLVWGQGVEADNGTRSEKEESFVYTVRQPFRATLSCERERAGAPCSPLAAVTVQFSADIDAAWAGQVKLVSAAAKGERKGEAPAMREGVAIAKAAGGTWIAPVGGGSERQKTTREVAFRGPFPQNARFRLELPRDMKDDAGRPLANAAGFPLEFTMGSLPPLAKFPGDFGIVELKEGGILPVTLRNIEARFATASQHLAEDGEVIAAMAALEKFESQTRTVKLRRDGREENYQDPYYARELSFLAQRPGVSRRELPKPGGAAEFEVVGIPLGKPGYHIVEIESRLLGAALLATPKPMYVRTAVLVTNLAVHLKRGRDNALVWVTALDSGKPVAGAEVRVSGCDGREQWRGRTDAEGRAAIDQALSVSRCSGEGFVFASARLGEDYSFVRSDWNQGIEPWRFGIETWGERSDFKIHTVFDRTLFRAGQTVSMKHIARQRDSRGFAFPDAAALPTKLTVRHAGTGAEFSQPLAWDGRGSAVSQWKIPDSAKRGTYEVVLSGGRRGMVTAGEFRVADFRLPVFTGSVQGVPAKQVAPGRVPLALGLSFLNGGAAKGAAVEVSATLRPRWPSYPNYGRFNFGVNLDLAALSGLPLPEEVRDRMLRGLAAFAEGRIRPHAWSPYDDLLVRKLQALEALTRHGQAPTRVAAALEVEPLRLPTAAAIDWYLTVKRLPDLPQRQARLAAAEQELRNRLSYGGGRLGFTTEKSDFWWWMMVSGDSNAFRLIEAVLDEPGWQEDLPRLLRGAVERQVRGRWYTTTANAWASLVLEKFGNRFEREAVTGITRASLGQAAARFEWRGAEGGTPEGSPLSLPWPATGGGRLAIAHEGGGKPWAAVQVLAAVPAGEAWAYGYRVSRRVTPVQEKAAGKASRGDLWRVTLDVEADQDMTWVVVSDPIPAGARILGDGDGRDSRIAGLDEDRRGRTLWPTFVERTFGFFRAYYEVVPKGHFRIDYTVRLNNAGEFSLPPTRVEAMYAPDVFGEVPNGKVVVSP